MVVKFSGKKRYEGVRFNVISVTRGWVGVQFPDKNRYVTLEWPLEDVFSVPCVHFSVQFKIITPPLPGPKSRM